MKIQPLLLFNFQIWQSLHIKSNRHFIYCWLFVSDFGTSSHVSAGNAKVEIHAGLTSNGKIVGTLFQSNAGIYRDYEDKEGFYIRLRGTFTRSVTFQMAFTSIMNHYTSGEWRVVKCHNHWVRVMSQCFWASLM